MLAEIVFANRDWLWPAVGLGAAGLILLVAGYVRSPLSGGVRWLAFLMKLCGLALLALCLLEPSWTGESPRKGANDLVVLADNSRGFSVRSGNGEETSGDAIARTLNRDGEGLPAWLEELNDVFRLQTYIFDSRLRRVTDFSGLDFTGDSSALLTALRSLKARFDQRPLAGMLVFTDGNATDTGSLESVVEALEKNSAGAGKPAPVFPVIATPHLEERIDLSVGPVTVAQSPFEDAPVTLTAEISGRGMSRREVAVVARNPKGEEAARETFRFGEDNEIDGRQRHTVRIRVPAVKPGVSFFEVAATESQFAGDWNDRETLAKKSGELTLENNRRLAAVDRGQGPYRVLYVGGRPNWEYKFLRRSLAADSEIQLTALIRIARREPKFEWRGRTGESTNPLFRGFESDIPEETQRYDQPVLIRMNVSDGEELRDGFPKSEAELFGEYRAIILDDVEAGFFTREQLNLIDRFVGARGGAVMMLGGQECFHQGKWNNTPVGNMLPVYLDRIGRGGPALEATFNLSREGWLEPWVRLRARQEDEETRLAAMPQFFSVNQAQAIKPGASVFATVTDSERRQFPALVTQRYGEGRTGAILIADLWRWGQKDADHQADLAKAWRQMLRWMVADVPDRIEVTTREESDGANPVVRLAVRTRNAAFRPLDNASVKLEISTPEGETSELFAEPSLEEAGLFEAVYYPRGAGAHVARALVRDGEGALLGERETGWAMNPAADEFASLEPNLLLLDRLAAATGGRVLRLDEVEDFVRELPKLDVPVTETWSRPLWHAPWVFLLALLLLAGEWGLRRWKGVL